MRSPTKNAVLYCFCYINHLFFNAYLNDLVKLMRFFSEVLLLRTKEDISMHSTKPSSPSNPLVIKFTVSLCLFFMFFCLFNTGLAKDNQANQDKQLSTVIEDKVLALGDLTEQFKSPEYSHLFKGNKETILNRLKAQHFEIVLVPCKTLKHCSSSYVATKSHHKSWIGYAVLIISLDFDKGELKDLNVKNGYVGL